MFFTIWNLIVVFCLLGTFVEYVYWAVADAAPVPHPTIIMLDAYVLCAWVWAYPSHVQFGGVF